MPRGGIGPDNTVMAREGQELASLARSADNTMALANPADPLVRFSMRAAAALSQIYIGRRGKWTL